MGTPVDTSDAPAGTSLHRRPARIAVFASTSLSLIGVAGQQGDVGTYRQGASVVFHNERMPAQRTDVDKRRDAKGRPAEVLLGKVTGWPAEVQWYPFFVVASSGRLKRRTHLPVRPYIASPCIAVLHASPVFSHFFVSPAWGERGMLSGVSQPGVACIILRGFCF